MLNFMMDAFRYQRRYAVERLVEEIVNPGQKHPGFSGEQIHSRLFNIGQARSSFLGTHMSGDSPISLLADGPDAVHYIVQETSFPFDTFGNYQLSQLHTPPIGNPLIIRPIPCPDVF